MEINKLLINYLEKPNTVRLNELSVSWNYELMDDFKQASFHIIIKDINNNIVYDSNLIESDSFSYFVKDINLNSHSKYFVTLDNFYKILEKLKNFIYSDENIIEKVFKPAVVPSEMILINLLKIPISLQQFLRMNG